MLPTTLLPFPAETPEEGACLMQAVSLWAGEEFSAWPNTTDDDLSLLGQAINDNLPDEDRDRLIAWVPRFVGTRDDGMSEARGDVITDWMGRMLAEVPPLRRMRAPEDYAEARDLYSCAWLGEVGETLPAFVKLMSELVPEEDFRREAVRILDVALDIRREAPLPMDSGCLCANSA